MNTSPPQSQRITWQQLPAEVHTWVNGALGSPVVSAVSQTGGFSLGTADRLITAQGRRAFLKAVSSHIHPGTANLHRQEAKVSAALPAQMPVAGFIGFSEITSQDGDVWVVLLLEDIEGQHPQQPWQHSELKAVFSTLDELRNARPDPALGLETSEESLTDELVFWQKISAGINADDLQYVQQTPYHEQLLALLPFAREQTESFAAYVNEHLIQRLGGQEYVHTDLRADNILLRPTGEAVLIDWPWATVGNADFDLACVAVDALIQDAQLTEAAVLALMPHTRRPAPEFLHATVIALAGYYLFASTLPPHGSTNTSLIEMRARRATALLTRLNQYQ